MERDGAGGSDYGREGARDLGDEPPASFRDHAPDILSPIDASAPVSGHVPPTASHRPAISETPEHDWSAAAALIVPLLRPAGTQGMVVTDIDAASLAAEASRSHSQPLLDEGPCGLA